LAAAISRLAAAALAALVFAAPAGAQSLDDVAAKLKREHVVAADPSVDSGALRARIGSAPTFLVVLPERTGSPTRTLSELRRAVGVEGSYALAVGDEFHALSDEFEDAAQVADTLRAQHPDDLQATLSAYVDRAAKERSGTGAGSILAMLALAAMLVGGVALVATRRARRLAEPDPSLDHGPAG
jgi:hypothetical protein